MKLYTPMVHCNAVTTAEGGVFLTEQYDWFVLMFVA